MDLKNVVIVHEGNAFSLLQELKEEERDYLTQNPNFDLFKLFFSKKCILFEGISEEMLIRSYLDSKNELSDIELISFHKGYTKTICVRRTDEKTLEPEIVKTGDNYAILKDKYGETLGWKDMSSEEMQKAWQNAKASDMLTICKDIECGDLPDLEMPKHIKDVFDFMKKTSVMVEGE